MSRFVFRLERVLHVRRIEEAQRKAEWAAASFEARRAEDSERAARDEVAAAEQQLAGKLSAGSVDPRRVLVEQDAIDVLRRRAVAAGHRAAELRSAAETCREAWTAARREHKALERLRERGATRHRAAEAREEAAAQDERALARSSERDSSPNGSPAEKASTPGPTPAA